MSVDYNITTESRMTAAECYVSPVWFIRTPHLYMKPVASWRTQVHWEIYETIRNIMYRSRLILFFKTMVANKRSETTNVFRSFRFTFNRSISTVSFHAMILIILNVKEIARQACFFKNLRVFIGIIVCSVTNESDHLDPITHMPSLKNWQTSNVNLKN